MEAVYMNSNSSVVFVNPPAALDLSTDKRLHFLLWYIDLSTDKQLHFLLWYIDLSTDKQLHFLLWYIDLSTNNYTSCCGI